MKIVVANQKGGVGKSTTCILLANYLALEKKDNVIILDMDFQDSIYSRWEKEKELYANDPLYEVIKMEVEEYPKYKVHIDSLQGGHVIMDMPGRLDTNELIAVYQDAEVIVCPFAYEKMTFESTMFFVQVAKHVNPQVKIVFLPNRLKSSVNYELKAAVDEQLAQFGTVAPALPDRVGFQRIDTVSISSDIRGVLDNSFGYIYNEYLETV